MAVGTIIPWIGEQFFDNNGHPLAGGKLWSYLAGLATPMPTYSDVGLTIEHPNPLVLDGSGRPPSTPSIFLAPTSYRFELRTSADVLLWAVDNISATPPNEVDLDVQLTAGEALLARDAVFIADGTGGTTAGRVYKTDADIVARSTGANIIGIVPAAVASGATGAIRLQGRVTGFSGLTPGAAYFISAVAGEITSVAPPNARFIGIADTTTSLVLTVSGVAQALPANPIFGTVAITNTGASALTVAGGIVAGYMQLTGIGAAAAGKIGLSANQLALLGGSAGHGFYNSGGGLTTSADAAGAWLFTALATFRAGLRIANSGGSEGMVLDAADGIYPVSDATVTCGKSGNRWISVWAQNGTIQTSDATTKTLEGPTPLGLDFVKRLQPMAYRWKDAPDGAQRHGLSGQQVEEALAGASFDGLVRTDDGRYMLNYAEFVAPLIKACQQLAERVEELEQQARDRSS